MTPEEILAALTLDEKASLTAGADMWTTPGIPRVGLPPIRLTDGPNGARGSSLLGVGSASAACAPCGAALGASWNPELVERVGTVLGEEAHTKGCRVLLAPTLNLHRSPVGGRNFECYAEDPLLAGRIAAGFVRGVQSQGIATTPKHFVANDAEFERTTINSVVDERTLRELYLVPFELAVKEGGALGIMTAYNRLNGVFCSESGWLLLQVLREEWGFEGFVLTDWFGIGSSQDSSRAGLDLQMPGPGRFYGEALGEAVASGDVAEETLDSQVLRMLRVWSRLGALDDPPEERPEQSIDRPEHRALVREAARESMVLLRNDGLLPLAADGLRRIAVIGPNADRAQIMGGGSAALRPHYLLGPLEALRNRVGADVTLVVERGCWTEKSAPTLSGRALAAPDGEAGLAVEFYSNPDWQGEPVARGRNENGNFQYFGPPADGVPAQGFSLRAVARFTPEESGDHAFTLSQAGRARLRIAGQILLDGVADPPPPGEGLAALASAEVEASIALQAGEPVEVQVEYSSREANFLRSVRIGHRPPLPDDLLERAEAAAASADAVVLVVGTNAHWETEGVDRASMNLPGDQDELIRRVCAANPRSVVCVNTGSPVAMDWAEQAGAVLQTWFGGQEMANALVDILFGDAEPSGRLPTTIPLCLEHNPSFGNFPGENSEIRYGEGLLIGYRWYDSRRLPVRFPFGHGLSYTRIEWGEPKLSAQEFHAGTPLRLEIPLTNRGERRGAEVVQCYVAPLDPVLFRPQRELRAFQKVWLDPGESKTVTLELGERAFAHWDPGDPAFAELRARMGGVAAAMAPDTGRRTQPGWYIDPGRYQLQLSRSADAIETAPTITIPQPIGPLQGTLV